MDAILDLLSDPRRIAAAAFVALAVKSLLDRLTRPKDLPPFYSETPYIPWLGSIVQFATGPREFLQRAALSTGTGCFTVQLFGKQMTFLTGSDGHAHFFKARENQFDIREAYAMTVITFGPGVCYDCPQSKMAQQFAFFKNGLSDECFVRYMDLVQEEAASFFESEWGDEGEACLLESLSDLFTLTSSRCLLGDEIRAKWKSSGMAEHYLALDHSFVPILFFFPWIPNPHRNKCVTARKLFEKMFKETIEERRKNPSKEKSNDFLQVLMEAKYRDGTALTVTEITGIMIGVLLGGQHTSNVTGTWLMSHLFKSKEWMDEIMDEQARIFSTENLDETLHPAKLSFADVQKMEVFDKALSEALRLHPPFFQLSRAVKIPSKFKGYNIPEGHIVNVSPGASHRLPDLWGDDADSFDPDRFSPERKNDIKPYGWIPFGGGMHQCGGRKFAWNSLKVSLSWLLRNYELEFVGKGAEELPKEDYTTMVVAPTSSHTRVRYRRRKPSRN
uniref:Cytochrome P450 n=1 Tax=Trieres chinensis TaxID=1514140 RepID=A0A7S1ZJQ1_TRICV